MREANVEARVFLQDTVRKYRYLWRKSANSNHTSKLLNDCYGTALGGVIDEPVMDRVEGKFQSIGDAKLVENIVQMVLDGLLGNE